VRAANPTGKLHALTPVARAGVQLGQVVAVTVERVDAMHAELQRRLAQFPTHAELLDRLAAKADAHELQVLPTVCPILLVKRFGVLDNQRERARSACGHGNSVWVSTHSLSSPPPPLGRGTDKLGTVRDGCRRTADERHEGGVRRRTGAHRASQDYLGGGHTSFLDSCLLLVVRMILQRADGDNRVGNRDCCTAWTPAYYLKARRGARRTSNCGRWWLRSSAPNAKSCYSGWSPRRLLCVRY
jgi:hypothetical protein